MVKTKEQKNCYLVAVCKGGSTSHFQLDGGSSCMITLVAQLG